jgi:hypothetical protein
MLLNLYPRIYPATTFKTPNDAITRQLITISVAISNDNTALSDLTVATSHAQPLPRPHTTAIVVPIQKSDKRVHSDMCNLRCVRRRRAVGWIAADCGGEVGRVVT